MDRLFLGGTQPRRSFLDRIVYAFDIEHAKRTANFEHLYKQWYQLLKNGCHDNGWLLSLEEEMAALGVAIAAARRELIARLNTFIEHEPDDVFPNISLELDGTIEKMLDRLPAVDVEDYYRNSLFSQRHSVLSNDYVDGVNRTDFKVYYKKKHMPAELCSTGEQKSLLVSIILAQTKCQILDKGFAPVLLLDEVTTHLDDLKRDALLCKIKNLNLQAWITSTEPQIFNVLKNDAQFFTVKNNSVNLLQTLFKLICILDKLRITFIYSAYISSGGLSKLNAQVSTQAISGGTIIGYNALILLCNHTCKIKPIGSKPMGFIFIHGLRINPSQPGVALFILVGSNTN